jgi:hypothetical protein
VNRGGGASEKWTSAGTDENVVLNRNSGNLRGEEEIYFQVRTAGLKPGQKVSRTLVFTGEQGSSDSVEIRFVVGK